VQEDVVQQGGQLLPLRVAHVGARQLVARRLELADSAHLRWRRAGGVPSHRLSCCRVAVGGHPWLTPCAASGTWSRPISARQRIDLCTALGGRLHIATHTLRSHADSLSTAQQAPRGVHPNAMVYACLRGNLHNRFTIDTPSAHLRLRTPAAGQQQAHAPAARRRPCPAPRAVKCR
jgi:hypothetical protein